MADGCASTGKTSLTGRHDLQPGLGGIQTPGYTSTDRHFSHSSSGPFMFCLLTLRTGGGRRDEDGLSHEGVHDYVVVPDLDLERLLRVSPVEDGRVVPGGGEVLFDSGGPRHFALRFDQAVGVGL